MTGGKPDMFQTGKRVSAFSAIVIVAVLLAVGALGGQAVGESRHVRASFVYLIATDFLCAIEPDACPAIAMASNGDTIEVTGRGTFTVVGKAVTGGGTFVHKNAAGVVLATGTWSAVQLLSFQAYGSGAAQGLPPETFGGKLMLRVLIQPDGAPFALFGILRVTCALGNRIPPSADEGVRLNVQDVINFNRELSGLTLYIRT